MSQGKGIFLLGECILFADYRFAETIENWYNKIDPVSKSLVSLRDCEIDVRKEIK